MSQTMLREIIFDFITGIPSLRVAALRTNDEDLSRQAQQWQRGTHGASRLG